MKRLLLLVQLLVPTAAFSAGEIVAVAQPDEKVPSDKTVVWTPLFQAAWDDLHQGFGEPVKVDPPNALMERLDHFKWDAKAVMPRDRWKVWSGEATQQLIDKANAEAARMLGEKAGPFKSVSRPGSRIALGLLDRDMVFKKPLHPSVNAPLAFRASDGSTSEVRFFGTRRKASAEYGGAVRVLAYQEGSHALQIAGDGDDCAVLYLPEKPVGLSEACGKLREWRTNPLKGEWGSAQDPGLHETDDVRIPVLKLENTTDFVPDLQSLRHFKSGPPWRVYQAQQRLKFQLTEKGAKLRAEVELGADPFGEPPKPKMVPRFFHYDRPFFVFLWRDGAEWPYFGAWIGNDISMEVFKVP
ncbi:MAG: hypothetical protein V4819_00710 [Verrucomicrobiota bacterium]